MKAHNPDRRSWEILQEVQCRNDTPYPIRVHVEINDPEDGSPAVLTIRILPAAN